MRVDPRESCLLADEGNDSNHTGTTDETVVRRRPDVVSSTETDPEYIMYICQTIGEVAHRTGRTEVVKLANHFYQKAKKQIEEATPIWHQDREVSK